MSSIGYLIKQGLKSTLKNSVMSFASIGVLLSCLLLIGMSVLFSLNINKVISDIERQNEIVVFLDDDVSEEQINDISEFLSELDVVETFDFINKNDALEKHIKFIGADSSLFDSLQEDNPLPDTYNVVLSDLSEIETCVKKIELLDGVNKVNAPVEVSKMIVSIKHAISIASVVIVAILLLVSLVIISNTIKLTIYSRRKEINIMKFVGASDFFIKLPFIVEGMFIGVTSAILAYVTLWIGYSYLVSKMTTINLQWVINLHNSMIPFYDYNLYILSGFLFIGVFIGIIGSSVFARKYLRV